MTVLESFKQALLQISAFCLILMKGLYLFVEVKYVVQLIISSSSPQSLCMCGTIQVCSGK